MPGDRVLVCGGRDYRDRDAVFRVLDWWREEYGVAEVIHGACGLYEYTAGRGATSGRLQGADRWADEWAIARGVPVRHFLADWRAHGRAAGPIRNQRMLDEVRPDVVIAFPGGRGTADMVQRARAAGVRVCETVRACDQCWAEYQEARRG